MAKNKKKQNTANKIANKPKKIVSEESSLVDEVDVKTTSSHAVEEVSKESEPITVKNNSVVIDDKKELEKEPSIVQTTVTEVTPSSTSSKPKIKPKAKAPSWLNATRENVATRKEVESYIDIPVACVEPIKEELVESKSDKKKEVEISIDAPVACMEPIKEELVEESKSDSATKSDSVAKSVEPVKPLAPVGDSLLLGAPIMDCDDHAADDILAPTVPLVEEEKTKIHPLAGLVGGFTAPLNINSSSEKSVGNYGRAALNKTAGVSKCISGEEVRSGKLKGIAKEEVRSEKLKDEIEHLASIVDSVESLEYLKPRMNKISVQGCQMSDLVGLYRMVSQVLMENMRTQMNAMKQMRDRYENRLRQVVMDKSSEFVKMVSDGTMPTRAERQAMSTPESSNMMFRKQMQIKDELLMKAREATAEAEARYEKLSHDVVNIRQRQEKDLTIQLQKSRESLFSKILPTLDSLDMALSTDCNNASVSDIIEGVTNIRRQLLEACQTEGLAPIEAKGQPFDPNLHEAMGFVVTSEMPEDYVVNDLRRGYTLNEKLLRATMVQLSREK